MRWYHYVAYFFGGAFLANALPHLGNGISGHAFQSPFASPPGEGLSSSTVNVLWGLLLRGRIPRQRPAPSRQWDLGARLPEPLRITTRGRLVLFDGQCPMGPLQPGRRLPAGLSRRPLRSAQYRAYARARGGHRDHVAHACPRIRTVPRRAAVNAKDRLAGESGTDPRTGALALASYLRVQQVR